MRTTLVLAAALLLAAPTLAEAQGTVRGAEQGAAAGTQGNRLRLTGRFEA